MVYLTRLKQGLIVKCREKRDKGCLVTPWQHMKKICNPRSVGSWLQQVKLATKWCLVLHEKTSLRLLWQIATVTCSWRLLWKSPTCVQTLTEQQQNCEKCDANQKQRLFVFKIKGPPSDPCWLQHWGTAFTLKVSNFHSVCVLCANYRWHWQSSSYQRMHKGMLELPNGL